MVIIKEGKVNINELISLIIQSGDQSIQCIVICKKTEIFNNVINKVFEKNPVFKNYFNYFLCNGSIVYEYKSLEENKIKNEDAVLLYKCEAVAELRKDMIKTFKESHLQTEEDIRRNIFGKLFDSLLIFFAPMV